MSPIAACVWRHCDGEHDMSELAGLAGASENLIADALHELREKDLLDAESQPMQSTVPGISRREAIGRAARYGAAAAAVPLIVSATAATPAMASSGEELDICKSEPDGGGTCCVCKNGCKSSTGSEGNCKTECEKTENGGYVDFKTKYVCT